MIRCVRECKDCDFTVGDTGENDKSSALSPRQRVVTGAVDSLSPISIGMACLQEQVWYKPQVKCSRSRSHTTGAAAIASAIVSKSSAHARVKSTNDERAPSAFAESVENHEEAPEHYAGRSHPPLSLETKMILGICVRSLGSAVFFPDSTSIRSAGI
jgi:hypothetical protein